MLQNLGVISQQLKTIDWPAILPIAYAIQNEQVSTKTGYPPCELFLGRPPLIFPKDICDDTLPSLHNWLSHQISQQEIAVARLAKLRDRALFKSEP